MNAHNELAEGIDAAMAALESITSAEAEADAPKPKTKRKAKKAEDVKAEKASPTSEAAKPEPEAAPKVLLDGYELKDDANPEDLKESTKEAASAADAILRKDADLLDSYLSLGAFNAKASKAFKSKKLMGQYIAEKVPASKDLDVALRSNCKWLWEALNDPEHEAFGKLLHVLKVNDLKSYKSANPTVIRREYTLIIKAEEAKATAEAEGIECEDPVKAVADAKKAKEAAEFESALAESLEIFADKITKGSFTKADIALSLVGLLRQVIPAKKEAALESLNVFKLEKAPKAIAKAEEPEDA